MHPSAPKGSKRRNALLCLLTSGRLQHIHLPKVLPTDLIVILTSFTIALSSLLPALTNKYIVHNDVNHNIYVFQRFSDPQLFRNDILTEYVQHVQPWGFSLLYRLLSYITDPLSGSKLLTIFLFTASSLYLFKLVQSFGGSYTGFLAVLLYLITPMFLNSMIPGTPRAFALPLLIVFLYYLIKKDYPKSAILLVIQCLFYPVVFVVSLFTYVLTFIHIRRDKMSVHPDLAKAIPLIISAAISLALLSSKYVSTHNPAIGNKVTRSQMLIQAQFYERGRYHILPVPTLFDALRTLSIGSSSILGNLRTHYPATVKRLASRILSTHFIFTIVRIIFLLLLCSLLFEAIRGRTSLPIELFWLALAAALTYTIATIMLPTLYIPDRYLLYTIPLITLILSAQGIGQFIARLHNERLVRSLRIVILIVAALHIPINKAVGLDDMSHYRQVFAFLNTLPKQSLVAAHPYLADYIPTFSARKVFINAELSDPWFDRYWNTIELRMRDFFQAYYATDLSSIREFCTKHGIDYLVVDKKDFSRDFLEHGPIYFEPFYSEVRDFLRTRQHFALLNLPDGGKLFSEGEIFAMQCPRTQ